MYKSIVAWSWFLFSIGLILLAVAGAVFKKEDSALVLSWVVALIAPLWAVLFAMWPNAGPTHQRVRPWLGLPLTILTLCYFGAAYAHFVGHAFGDRLMRELIEETKDVIFVFQGALIAFLAMYLGRD